MKKYTKEELLELSKTYFETHPKEDVFHATEDGMFFTTNSRGDAVNHSRNVGGELFTIARSEALAEKHDEGAEEMPTDKWNNASIKAWMSAHQVAFEDKDTKAQLLEKIAASVHNS